MSNGFAGSLDCGWGAVSCRDVDTKGRTDVARRIAMEVAGAFLTLESSRDHSMMSIGARLDAARLRLAIFVTRSTPFILHVIPETCAPCNLGRGVAKSPQASCRELEETLFFDIGNCVGFTLHQIFSENVLRAAALQSGALLLA